jgi:hypothetical protein
MFLFFSSSKLEAADFAGCTRIAVVFRLVYEPTLVHHWHYSVVATSGSSTTPAAILVAGTLIPIPVLARFNSSNPRPLHTL